MRRGLIEGGYESTAVKSGAINQLEGVLSKLLFVLQTRGLGYRCILSRQSSEFLKIMLIFAQFFAVQCAMHWVCIAFVFGPLYKLVGVGPFDIIFIQSTWFPVSDNLVLLHAAASDAKLCMPVLQAVHNN